MNAPVMLWHAVVQWLPGLLGSWRIARRLEGLNLFRWADAGMSQTRGTLPKAGFWWWCMMRVAPCVPAASYSHCTAVDANATGGAVHWDRCCDQRLLESLYGVQGGAKHHSQVGTGPTAKVERGWGRRDSRSRRKHTRMKHEDSAMDIKDIGLIPKKRNMRNCVVHLSIVCFSATDQNYH